MLHESKKATYPKRGTSNSNPVMGALGHPPLKSPIISSKAHLDPHITPGLCMLQAAKGHAQTRLSGIKYSPGHVAGPVLQ